MDPTSSGKPLGCLPGLKTPGKIQKSGIPRIRGNSTYFPLLTLSAAGEPLRADYTSPPAAQDSNLVCGKGGLVNPVGLELPAHRRPHIWPGRCASRARNHHPPQPGQNPHEMGRHKCSGAPEAGILHRISSRIFLEGSRALNLNFLIPLKNTNKNTIKIQNVEKQTAPARQRRSRTPELVSKNHDF